MVETFGEWISELDESATADGNGQGRPTEIQLTKPQFEVYSSTARFRVLVAGRRFGKTYLSIPELIRMANGPDREAWYIAPTYRQAKQIAWKQLKKTARPYIAGKPNETDLSIDLLSGGRIALRGAENYDSLRGPGLDGLILDEAADIPKEAWTEVLRPMLADRLGCALFIGTPEGFNHFHEWYDEAREKPDWASWQFTTLQGGNVAPEEVEAARRDLDEKTFRQEFEASFENIGSGRAYYAFERGGNVGPVEFNQRLPLCWSLDFNIGLMCSVLAQYEGDRLSVLEELVLPDSSTHDACAEFLVRAEKYLAALRGTHWGVVPLTVKVYGDASGANRMHAGPSDWQIVRDFFGRVSDRINVTYHVRSSNPAVKDRIAAVNARVLNYAGERRLTVDAGCKELIADLEQVKWQADPHGNTLAKLDGSNPKRTHISDALGYLIEKEFGLRVIGGPRATNLGV